LDTMVKRQIERSPIGHGTQNDWSCRPIQAKDVPAPQRSRVFYNSGRCDPGLDGLARYKVYCGMIPNQTGPKKATQAVRCIQMPQTLTPLLAYVVHDSDTPAAEGI
jgi:hypothetical protein